MTFEEKSCEYFQSLLVKKIAGELLSEERQVLQTHLSRCSVCPIEEKNLAGAWDRLASDRLLEIPRGLSETTRQSIVDQLRQEKFASASVTKSLSSSGMGSLLMSVAGGLLMTWLSYGLIHRQVGLEIHHHHILLPLFGFWWLAFTAASWLTLGAQKRPDCRVARGAACAIAIVFLTLTISFLVYEIGILRSFATIAAEELAAATESLVGIGNAFVTAWWIHCCLASFIAALFIRINGNSRLATSLLFAPLSVTVMLYPAIYLQGSSHDHGFWIIAFAAIGTYIGSLFGVSLGLFGRHRIISLRRA